MCTQIHDWMVFLWNESVILSGILFFENICLSEYYILKFIQSKQANLNGVACFLWNNSLVIKCACKFMIE